MSKISKLKIVAFIYLMYAIGILHAGQDIVVIAMCRPTVSQIQNIVDLYERDLLTIQKIRLLCIYHEEEVTDYQPSLDHVKEQKLNWIRFYQVKGMVPMDRLFSKNGWTPQFKDIFSRSHGIIFTGGMDIPPSVYRQETHLLTENTTPIRSLYECSFLFHLIGGSQNAEFLPLLHASPSYPILGICLGCQTMNVAAGGTLIQDIPSDLYGIKTIEQLMKKNQDHIHSSRYLNQLYPLEKDLARAFHRIQFVGDSLFVSQMGMKPSDHPYVLTSHHQAVGKLGQNILVTARSMDGKVVEGIQHRRFPNVLGVQFHPESRDLFRKGAYYKQSPHQAADFNPRLFLTDHLPSMDFHKSLWRWFSQALKTTADFGKS